MPPTTSQSMMPAVGRDLGGPSDLVGAALVAALTGWFVVATLLHGGSPWSGIGTLVLAAAAYAAGRSMGSRSPVRAATAVAAGVAVVEAAGLAWSIVGHERPGLALGYDNADAALLVQGAAAAALVAATAAGAAARSRAVTGCAVLVAGTLLLAAQASVLAGAVVLGAAVLVARGRPTHAEPWVLGALAGVAAVVAATVVLADPALDGAVREPAASALSWRRLDLWADARRLTLEQPVLGVGPGRFQEFSLPAQDPDTPYPHSLLLGQAAETGLPGAGLLAALLGWGVWRVRRAAGPGAPPAAVAVAAWTAFAVTSAGDYVAQFPLVTAVSAVVVGIATGAALHASRC